MKSSSDEAQPHPAEPLARTGLTRRFAWGLLDQLASSGTNFGLSLVGGRLLGVSGLGVITIGFSAYLIVLGFQRSLLSDPFIVVSSEYTSEERRRGTKGSITATVGLGLVAAAIIAVLGLWIGGAIGRGLLIFAPWLVPALIQDLWRMLLFRDERGGAATANDAVWLTTMSGCLLISRGFHADWVLVSCWGLGAMASTIFGFAQLRAWGAPPKSAWKWMITDAWPVGRWFAAGGIVYTIASQLVVFLLAGLLGAAAVGGLRSVQVIFAPLSVLGPAAALPGLPMIRKAVGESHAKARTLALRLSTTLLLLTSAYLLACWVNRALLLTAVFGPEFARYGGLIWPIGVHQLVTAAAGGYDLLLKAHRGGKRILLSLSLSSLVTLALLGYLSLRFGILGGAWAIALGASIGTASIIAFASRVDRIGQAEIQ
jgi:O-antigen/teichoic acid export membrane protein